MVVKEFKSDGFRAIIFKHDDMGHLCGYIGLPKGHNLHGQHYDEIGMVDVHGGWTYSQDHAPFEETDGSWYIGFDCAHAGDLVPGMNFKLQGDVYRDEAYVESEIRAATAALK